ncbi:MAG TPA: malonate decarboxylase subunit epsilon, partial [Sutterella sp.]|nr:malonate decarboxylase subunit epsilon [Sutterella sp.]
GYGMTALIGLRLLDVEAICREIPNLYVANYNAETQVVISGS